MTERRCDHLRPEQVEQASLTLARSFADDPVVLHLAGGRTLPERTLAKFFEWYLRVKLPKGEVYATPGLEAVSIWSPPDAWRVPLGSVARGLPSFVRLYGRLLFSNFLLLNDMERRHPRAPHYYLAVIGTDPPRQGEGWGSALMTPMVERSDREGVPLFLESSKESNLGYYARFGFEVTEMFHHRRNGPPMWLMWRDPR